MATLKIENINQLLEVLRDQKNDFVSKNALNLGKTKRGRHEFGSSLTCISDKKITYRMYNGRIGWYKPQDFLTDINEGNIILL